MDIQIRESMRAWMAEQGYTDILLTPTSFDT